MRTLRATWIFTRGDVIANLAVILSGLTIFLTGFRFVDLIVGAAIGLHVIAARFSSSLSLPHIAQKRSGHSLFMFDSTACG
jgi:Co/Zn/Cd efflux system component